MSYASIGSMVGGLSASAFVKCFVGDTPVLVGVEEQPYVAVTSTADQDEANSSIPWLAFGVASALAAKVVSGGGPEKKKSGIGSERWPVGEAVADSGPPELDVSQIDFADVCEELLCPQS